jgi:leucine dehydrogenase
MWPFASEDEALEDVLRLSRGMTYQAAVAGLNLGGGKAVIIGDPKKDKSEALFRAFGRFVHSLGGRYITAEDVGTSVHDIEWVRAETPYVTGIGRALGGSGDPSPMTALGVHTGYWLASYLHKDGVKMIVTDIDEDRVRHAAEEFDAQPVAPDEIYETDAAIFAPCALGGVVNDDTIGRLRCRIVAGSANNVLKDEDKHGPMLREKGILYAPDFVINSGGLINVANELEGYNQERVKRQIEKIYYVLKEIFEVTKRENIPTGVAATRVAEARIQSMLGLKNTWVGPLDLSNRRR